jgi:5-methylcytosine-specific restriction endonuclease McrA
MPKLKQKNWVAICRKPEINLNEQWGLYREDRLVVEKLEKYKLVRHKLNNGQKGLCAECNRAFNMVDYEHSLYWQIDHILPKVMFPELMFDLTNMRLVCKGCNEKKGAIFGRASAERALSKLVLYRKKLSALRG